MRRKGIQEVFVRLNTKSQQSEWLSSELANWVHHPDHTVDVSVLCAGLLPHHDHVSLGTSFFAVQSTFEENEAGPGDEMIITGLFKHHTGDSRNIPIVRVGNLAAMNEVTVTTQIGQIDAYLAEVRSIGGLSGSPAFLNLGVTRRIGGKVKQATSDMIFLLGLVHGHYDEFLSRQDQVSLDDDLSPSRINTGIAIIVPSEKIMEAIQHAEALKA